VQARVKPTDNGALDGLPKATAELVLIRTQTQALTKVLGRKKSEKFMREWVALLATEETVRLLLPIRSPQDRETVSKVQREACAWVRQVLPTLIASLPPE
jgi:hypothetical protein